MSRTDTPSPTEAHAFLLAATEALARYATENDQRRWARMLQRVAEKQGPQPAAPAPTTRAIRIVSSRDAA